MIPITTEEKIDYIYESIKRQEKREFYKSLFKWVFRLALIGYFVFFYYYMLPWLIENIKSSIKPSIESLNPWVNMDNINRDELLNKFKSIINK